MMLTSISTDGGRIDDHQHLPQICEPDLLLRVPRLHLIEHSLAPANHDDLAAEFDELEQESKVKAGGAPVIRMVRLVRFMGVLS